MNTLLPPGKVVFVESGDILKKWVEQVKLWRNVHGQTFSAIVNKNGTRKLIDWNSDLENLLMAEIYPKWENVRTQIHTMWSTAVRTIIGQTQTKVSAFRNDLVVVKVPQETVDKVCTEAMRFTARSYHHILTNNDAFRHSQAKHRDEMVSSIKNKLLPVYEKARTITGKGRANAQHSIIQDFFTNEGITLINEFLSDAQSFINNLTHKHVEDVNTTVAQIVSGVKEIIGVVCRESVQHEDGTIVEALDNSNEKLKNLQFQLDLAVQELSYVAFVDAPIETPLPPE